MWFWKKKAAVNKTAAKNNKKSGYRSELGRQEEKNVAGKRRITRKEDERFQGKIKGVDVEKMHEDFYDVDVLK